MVMTKEALQENYGFYIKSFEEMQYKIDMALGICGLATIIIFITVALVSYLKRTSQYVMTGITMLTIIWVGFGVFVIAMGMNQENNNSELEYKINTIMPYLFKNEETADRLKRFDKVNIQVDQNKLLNSGIIKGKVIVNDNGEELIYPFNQITLGVTSENRSYLEVNSMDVELSEKYPKGKVFNVLYLNDVDYTTFMNLFGEIPIRIEK